MKFRSKATVATPSQLRERLNAAQARHAEAVATANAQLLDEHDAAVGQAVNRRQTIDEQIDLLTAERENLVLIEQTPRPDVGVAR